ncbi:hypothetical protein JAAARDRAFT_34990 [Jaapia argillacea MUCL 33604]|uniref:Uncharacterized protein n=1 Tax=Jaapia argillacea MUCL 33604 TaxID=933084 RepID=A0A067Q3V2_9AGAM|nr:hypothetical protein JAAARDRAFT_34990 [Jaapia argillacea MUCL 33604]
MDMESPLGRLNDAGPFHRIDTSGSNLGVCSTACERDTSKHGRPSNNILALAPPPFIPSFTTKYLPEYPHLHPLAQVPHDEPPKRS